MTIRRLLWIVIAVLVVAGISVAQGPKKDIGKDVPLSPPQPDRSTSDRSGPPTKGTKPDNLPQSSLSIDVDVVSFDVVVTDQNGNPIGGLQKQHFKVFDNDVEQEISNFSPTDSPLTVVILAEFSATIGYYIKRTGIPVNFGITVALGFIVGAAVVGQTFYIFVIENLRQFGALKAMGVGNGTILRMVLLQAMVVAGIGYAIGIGLCAGFFEITSRVSIDLRGFQLPWQVALGTACAVLVIIVIASFASLRKVMVVDPAIVFRG